MALNTVGDYITEARRLLQDTRAPYRYPDADIIGALNLGLSTARRVRADLFVGRFNNIPTYTTTAEVVPFDIQYQSSLLYFVVGHIGLRDAEASQDTRALGFVSRFNAQLLSLQG